MRTNEFETIESADYEICWISLFIIFDDDIFISEFDEIEVIIMIFEKSKNE